MYLGAAKEWRMSPHDPPVTAAVLAGGTSRRMGTDKRRLVIAGRTLLSHVLDVTARVCPEVMVVTADRADGARLRLPEDVRVVPDVVSGLGPLGGIATALIATRTEWTLVVAADMPLVRAEVLQTLLDAREGRGAVVPVGPRGREPLIALYHTDCVIPALELLGRQDAGPIRLLDLVECVEVPLGRLRLVDPGLVSLHNVNTPADLAEAELVLNDPSACGSRMRPAPPHPTVVSAHGVLCGWPAERGTRHA